MGESCLASYLVGRRDARGCRRLLTPLAFALLPSPVLLLLPRRAFLLLLLLGSRPVLRLLLLALHPVLLLLLSHHVLSLAVLARLVLAWRGLLRSASGGKSRLSRFFAGLFAAQYMTTAGAARRWERRGA